LHLIRALSWKSGIDQNVLFVDGTPLPMAIIQNKLDKITDLTEKADFMKFENLQEYSRKNNFDVCYQTSAKTGENIENSISGFIKMVIDKYERYLSTKVKETVVEDKNRTVVLTGNNNTSIKEGNRSSKSCCK
jgi:hypothetical protein